MRKMNRTLTLAMALLALAAGVCFAQTPDNAAQPAPADQAGPAAAPAATDVENQPIGAGAPAQNTDTGTPFEDVVKVKPQKF